MLFLRHSVFDISYRKL